MRKIVINGKSYSSIEKMPSEIRKIYQETIDTLADKDNNGIPDILEGKMASRDNVYAEPVQVVNTNIINYKGKTYTDISQLPPDVQRKYKLAMEKVDKIMSDNNETPDMIEIYQPSAYTVSTTSFEENDGKPSYRRGLIILGIILALITGALLMRFVLHYL